MVAGDPNSINCEIISKLGEQLIHQLKEKYI